MLGYLGTWNDFKIWISLPPPIFFKTFYKEGKIHAREHEHGEKLESRIRSYRHQTF